MPDWLPAGVPRNDPSRATYALSRLIMTLLFHRQPGRHGQDASGRTLYNVSSREQNSGEVYGLSLIIMVLSLLGILIPSIQRFGWRSLLFIPLWPFIFAVFLNLALTLFALVAWPLRRLLPRFDELRFNSWMYHLLFTAAAIFFFFLDSPLHWVGLAWLILLMLNGLAAVIMQMFYWNGRWAKTSSARDA